MTPPTTDKPRRTQEQRTAETRAKLLDATIESLLDAGYAATTTRRVAELAGVSQGAQTHHFPYRADLVVAAVERSAEQRIAAVTERIPTLPDDPVARIDAVLDGMWSDFSSDLFTVFVKAWVAAADDRELNDRLVPIERKIGKEIARVSIGLLADLPTTDDMEARLTAAFATMRGLALQYRFEPTNGRPRDMWAEVRPVLAESLRGGLRI